MANDQNLIVASNTLLASGDKGAVTLHADFSCEWDGYAKTAVFYQNKENVYYAILNDNGECVIPWEAMKDEGIMFFGIFGAKNDTRKTSKVVRYRIRKGAWSEETAVSDPTPDIYTQILSNIAAHTENKSNPHGVTAEQLGSLPLGGGVMQGSIVMGGNKVTGLGTPTAEGDAVNLGTLNNAVSAAAPHNLLDNSDFRNPVNQRGQQTYTGEEYSIDRWIISGNAAEQNTIWVDNGYIAISGGNTTENVWLVQKVPSNVMQTGSKATFAVKQNSFAYPYILNIDAWGTDTSITFENGVTLLYQAGELIILNGTGAPAGFNWAALYEGEYTAETLPEYQPKGYAAELAECQRYYRKSFIGSNPTDAVCSAVVHTNNAYSTSFYMGFAPMRTTPTVQIYSSNGTPGAVTEYGSEAEVSEVSIYNQSPYGFYLVSGGRLNAQSTYIFNYTASADL